MQQPQQRPGRQLLYAFLGLAILGAIGAYLMRGRRTYREVRQQGAPPTPLILSNPKRLDVAAFREDLTRRKAMIEALRARKAAGSGSGSSEPYQPPDAKGLVSLLVNPFCVLGPGELCTALADVITACDGGDGASCLALAQSLQDTPPRPRMAVLTFLMYACKRGEAAGCARLEEIKRPFTGQCADDPISCAQDALRKEDPKQIADACTAGVGDACVWMSAKSQDRAAQRDYLAKSCQLGNSRACTGLGEKLSPDCKNDCFPPDPEQAAAALAIGCAAGWADACK